MSKTFGFTELKTLIGLTWLVCIGFKQISFSTLVMVAFSIELLIFVNFSSKKALNICPISASAPQPTGRFFVVLTPISILKLLYFFLRSTFWLTCSTKNWVFFEHLLTSPDCRKKLFFTLVVWILLILFSEVSSVSKSWISMSKKKEN